jgi:hypothetical protein
MNNAELGLYDLLEALLKKANRPVTCVDLFALPEVKAKAASVNRVSDYLGGLWRKGRVSRSPAARSSKDSSHWAYSWRTEKYAKAPKRSQTETSRVLTRNPNVVITEDGDSITIVAPKFTITLKATPDGHAN